MTIGTQATTPDPRPFRIYRNRRGWPAWYQRWLEAWWIVTGKWSLHRAWQEGVWNGSRTEYQRIIVNGGDMVPFQPLLRKIVDATYGYAREDESVPSTAIADNLILRARQGMTRSTP